MKKLTPDGNFSPCPQAENDEMYPNGIFLFNITRMIDYLHSEESDIAVEQFRVADYPRYSTDSLNESHIDTTDLNKPVILAEISPARYNVIDGHHRMEKARRNGVTTLPCYRIPPTVHTRFLANHNAYDSYIDYWNDKIDAL